MSDFFADLERQLVAATPQRAQRVRRARVHRAAALSTTLLAVLACGAGVAAAIRGGGGDDGPAGAPAGTRTTQTQPPPRTVALSPRTGAILPRRTIAVLNATTVPGLARGVANRLQNSRFKIGNVTNAATQDRSATRVEFAPGQRAEAEAVAQAIGVGRAAIRPLSPGSKTIAGDQAAVVVLVGSDQNAGPIR